MSISMSQSLTYYSGDATNNTAIVKYEVFATTSGKTHSDYSKTTTVNVDGQTASGTTTLPYNSTVTCFSGWFTIQNASGKTITGSYDFVTGDVGAGEYTGSTTLTIPVLVKTPTVTCSTTRGLNSIGASLTVTNNGGASIQSQSIRLFSDSNCTNQVGSINGTSGTFTGLTPNTTYYARAQAYNGTFTGYSSVQTVSTYNKATISNAPNINHGNTLAVTYSNPSSSSIQIGLYKTDGTTALASYRNCSGTSYTFTFTDTELDNIYRLYGNNNSIQVRVYLRTANNSSYLDYKTITITLKGNQKTMREKVNNTWKRGKAFIKVNGTWKNGVVWEKVNGTWKRGI